MREGALENCKILGKYSGVGPQWKKPEGNRLRHTFNLEEEEIWGEIDCWKRASVTTEDNPWTKWEGVGKEGGTLIKE